MTAAGMRRRAAWCLAIGAGMFAGTLVAVALFANTAPADVPLHVDHGTTHRVVP